MAGTQTRRKRRIGTYLRKLREQAGRSPEEAAELLGVRRPTITRMENGESLCRRAELPALCGFYGATDEQRTEALTLWEDAKLDPVRIVLPGSTPRQLRSYVRAEADASEEKIISTLIVPGLLQTAEYATAITQEPSGFRSPDPDIERIVEARLSRQQRMRGSHPLRIRAVFDEAVIRRMVGGAAVMRAQLSHLLTIAELPQVTIQVVPFSVGAYGATAGDAYVLEFPDPDDPAAAYVEYIGGGRWIEDPDDVAKLATTFDQVAEVALPPVATAELVTQQIEALENHE